MGLILFIVCLILSPLLLAGLIYGLFEAWYKKKFWHSFKNIDKKFLSMAEAFDRFGNVVCGELFNLTLRKYNGHKFGHPKETISSALGKNQRDITLTLTGRVIVWILDKFEKNHSLKSIQD